MMCVFCGTTTRDLVEPISSKLGLPNEGVSSLLGWRGNLCYCGEAYATAIWVGWQSILMWQFYAINLYAEVGRLHTIGYR
jgi:hypothetical protein